MKLERLKIKNFRGIKNAEIFLNGHTVIVGDNNVGKSTIIEAIDLVLGPDRLSRYPIIDEHDFYAGDYIGSEDCKIQIEVEAIIIDLNEEQLRHFRNNIEWWDIEGKALIDSPPASRTDEENVVPALRVCFTGEYDFEEDDFIGNTFFCSPISDEVELPKFGTRDKRLCGFIYLRTLRTGSRALSLEKGSLLDIILKLKEIRPQMWEDILSQLRQISIAEKPELGISEILENIQTAIREFVPVEWAENPKLQVSDMTRFHLRKILTVFIGTGVLNKDGEMYSAPFQHQGTGTINALVLTLLSIIAELKQNVIFAMEEPEIAIPPYTQKRIINSIIGKSAQAIFTSHSPYVLEEFVP
jgi:putative ATP-dependent endonuclease of OLD family